MKLKIRKKKSLGKGSTTVRAVDGVIEITHSQSIKQSLNYQSADVSYGVRLRVEDNDKVVKKAVERAEELVEDNLVQKFKEQQDMLRAIAAQKAQYES